MFPYLLSPTLVERIRGWDGLKRWEKKEIGQELRRLGLTYKEISAVIPVHKGTLSGWCRDLPPIERKRYADRRAVGAKLRKRSLDRYDAIRRAARAAASARLDDPFWTAGVVAYWAEGSKRTKEVRFANSDPTMVRLFVEWAERYLESSRETLSVQMHLHSGQDESDAREFWSSVTGVPTANFIKTYVKAEGTGHRKNVLYRGTVSIRVPRSTELLQQILGWIDALANHYAGLGYPAAGC